MLGTTTSRRRSSDERPSVKGLRRVQNKWRQNLRIDLLGVYARRVNWVSYTFHGMSRALRVGALASIMQTSHRSGQRELRASVGAVAEEDRSRSCRESKQED